MSYIIFVVSTVECAFSIYSSFEHIMRNMMNGKKQLFYYFIKFILIETLTSNAQTFLKTQVFNLICSL